MNKKKNEQQQFKEDENDEDEEDDEEDEQDDERDGSKKEKVVDKSQTTGITSANKYFKDVKFAPKPRKVILDADIRLNSAFGDALKKILNTRNLKNDIRRNRRNFLTNMFSKKKTKLKDKEKNSDKGKNEIEMLI